MSLTEYQRKRDFQKTTEPHGMPLPRAQGALAFVVQKHDASHLHYDFRLELDGVLKSWAVPKGPDLDPANKRLAMQVEDHPLEYGSFEGIIPQGQYGAGTVLLWDKGVWEPIGDPKRGYKDGRLKFILRGEKLQGAWMLVRKGGRRSEEGERHWFLFKERDEFARPGESVTDAMPLSVMTGRDIDQIAAQSAPGSDPTGAISRHGGKNRRSAQESSLTRRGGKKESSAVATSDRRPVKPNAQARDRASSTNEQARLHELLQHPAVKRARLPESHAVELATLVEEAPSGADWLHEIKYDGYRMLCRLDRGKARFISRNGHEWTAKFPELAEAASTLAVERAMLDGEVVALQPDGTTSFQALQNAFQAGRTDELAFYVFDILHLDGHDVTGVPLEERKEILRLVLSGTPHQAIRYSDHLEGTGQEIFKHACRLHLEGIVSKRRGSVYRPGRGLDWLKVKCSLREEFVIGGFTRPSGRRSHFGALLVGYHDRGKKLVYAGRVGTGFSERTLDSLYQQLTKLVQPKSPFVNLLGTRGQARDVTWVKPTLVAAVEFSNWTDERLLRQPSFQGLREDTPASKVVRDEPLSLREVQAAERGREANRIPDRATKDLLTSKRVSKPVVDLAAEAEVAGVRLSHPDKVLYSDQGITKRDLARYYERVADWILPHVVDRPLALVRCPGGRGKPCFFQKHPGEGAPAHLRQVNVSEIGAPEYNLAVKDLAGLIALVQMGVLEIHIWGSRMQHLEKPDRLVFDLDPDASVDWQDVIVAAREVRAVLKELGLDSFPKTTGGKGLHIVVPVRPRTEWAEAKAFCRAVADFMVRAAPDRYIATASKAARKGKIFIDYLRNARGSTAIAPYSTRSKPGATVSVPLAWEELSAKLRSDHFTIENVPARLKKLRKDPWAELLTTRQSITARMMQRVSALRKWDDSKSVPR